MKIYTKQGDSGTSVLFDGQRVPKHHLRLETYGTLDELNSHLGLAIATCRHAELADTLQSLQHLMFVLGSDLATPLGSQNESKVRRVGPAEIHSLEEKIDAATVQLPPLKQFILPGGGLTACHLHVARTVCRRAERHLAALMSHNPPAAPPAHPDPVGEHPLILLNRLSDLLFTLARLANKLDSLPDVVWDMKK